MNRKFFPRVNLQISSLLSPGEVMMMTGFTPNNEPNFDIYVHTIVSNPRRNSNNNNQLVVSGFSADYHNHQLSYICFFQKAYLKKQQYFRQINQ